MRLTKTWPTSNQDINKKEHQLSYNNTNVYICNTLLANANQYNTERQTVLYLLYVACVLVCILDTNSIALYWTEFQLTLRDTEDVWRSNKANGE